MRWGFIFWYITFGIIIALTGMFVRHPIFKFPLNWYVRSAIVGGWLNFTVTFFKTLKDINESANNTTIAIFEFVFMFKN